MRPKSVLAAVSVLILSASSAAAEGSGIIDEVKLGLLHHDTDNLWSGFSRESGVDINAEAIFRPSLDLLGGKVQPAFGVSLNSTGDTSKIYLDARWRYQTESGVFFGLGAGGAVHDGDTDLESNDRKALGSKVLFHIPIEIGYRFNGKYSASVYFDHVSNVYLADANEGMDTLGVRIGYKFQGVSGDF